MGDSQSDQPDNSSSESIRSMAHSKISKKKT